MKIKKCIFPVVIVFCSSLLSAQKLTDTEIQTKGKGIPIEIKYTTPVKSGSSQRYKSFSNMIFDQLRQNINGYTEFDLIDSENTSLYIEEMRRKESDFFADEDKPIVGNYRAGRYFFNYTFTIDAKGHLSLTIDFVHVQSGTVLATNTGIFTEKEVKQGIAVGSVFLKVLEQLGFRFNYPSKKHLQGVLNSAFFEVSVDGGAVFSGYEKAGFSGMAGIVLNFTDRHHVRFDVPFRFNDNFEIGGMAEYMFTFLKNEKNTISCQIGGGIGLGLGYIEIPVTLRFNYKYFEILYTTAWKFDGYFEDNVVCGVVIPIGGKK